MNSAYSLMTMGRDLQNRSIYRTHIAKQSASVKMEAPANYLHVYATTMLICM